MPGRDRTGPMGMGAMTGRGAGFCSGIAEPGYMTPGFGRGCGYGAGRGRRNRFYATGVPGYMRFGGRWAMPQSMDAGWERQVLQNQSQALQSQLEAVKQRLAEIATTKGDE